MKNLCLSAVLGCVLGAGNWCCATCVAQIVEPRVTAREDLGVKAAADILVLQLRSTKIEVRENAATTLQTMGVEAAKALATYIRNNLSDSGNSGVIKAAVVLGKIGNDIADDDDVRDALRSAASLKEQTSWPELQLAAIDALREINKYRGGILSIENDKTRPTLDPVAVVGASDKLTEIAEEVFQKLRIRSVPRPTPLPSWDDDFYTALKTLRGSQVKLVKAAALPRAAATSPWKREESTFSRLTDAKTLADSLRRIEVGYSDATKTTDMQKLKLERTYDKTAWQFQTEAAYDLLTETGELRDQLHKAIGTFNKSQDDLAALVSDLATISANSNSEAIKAAVAGALNGIFFKRPEKKLAAEPANRGAAKKEADKEGFGEKRRGQEGSSEGGDVKE